MLQKETGFIQKQQKEDEIERIGANYKFIVAVGLLILFGATLITCIIVLQYTQSIAGIAGIFVAWIGAIITFYYMEHQSTERVREVRESEKMIRSELENAQTQLPEEQEQSTIEALETRRALDELTRQLEKERQIRNKLEIELAKYVETYACEVDQQPE